MLKRLGIGEFIGLLVDHIEERTGLRCYDSPENEESPFYAVDFQSSRPENTKTMFMDVYEVWIHCISAPTKPHSSAPVLRLAQSLDEAMTDDLALPAPFRMHRQDRLGVQALKIDESDEGHAVMSFEFRVCYGFRCK